MCVCLSNMQPLPLCSVLADLLEKVVMHQSSCPMERFFPPAQYKGQCVVCTLPFPRHKPLPRVYMFGCTLELSTPYCQEKGHYSMHELSVVFQANHYPGTQYTCDIHSFRLI